MQLLSEYWLAIVVSAVAVFLVSSVMHMVLQYHRTDFQKLPHESDALEKMRTMNLAPGSYSFPLPDSVKEMSSPEMLERYKQGPVGIMTVLPNGMPALGKNLFFWFLYSLLISFFVAYVALIGTTEDAGAMAVFRLTSAVAILGYALGHCHESIWKGQSWVTTGKFLFDGVVYGLVTAAIFAWLG